jgi:hypothetical protein
MKRFCLSLSIFYLQTNTKPFSARFDHTSRLFLFLMDMTKKPMIINTQNDPARRMPAHATPMRNFDLFHAASTQTGTSLSQDMLLLCLTHSLMITWPINRNAAFLKRNRRSREKDLASE